MCDWPGLSPSCHVGVGRRMLEGTSSSTSLARRTYLQARSKVRGGPRVVSWFFFRAVGSLGQTVGRSVGRPLAVGCWPLGLIGLIEEIVDYSE